MDRFLSLIVAFFLAFASLGQNSEKSPGSGEAKTSTVQILSGSDASNLAQDSAYAKADGRYQMRVSSDEVSLVFHAADKSGRPVNDLKPADIDLFDNERGPGAIVAMRLLKDRPLRVGFLVDTSGSVSDGISRSRTIAVAAAQALMQNSGDSGAAIGFGRTRDILQPWSTDLNAVAAGIRRIGSKPDAVLDGTSLFDSLWSTCFYEYRGQQKEAQNVLLLFTDGLDTSSHTTLEQAVGACQQAHTSVFVYTSTSDLSDVSMGHRTLRKLSEQTGGGLIQRDGSDAGVRRIVEALAADLRSEYQLFYRPENLKRDGTFHRIILVGPPRVAAIVGQSGYYALAQ